MPGTELRTGCLSPTLASGKRKQGPGGTCRIWDGLSFFPPAHQHVFATLPQGEVVQEEVHDQRALPINVE